MTRKAIVAAVGSSWIELLSLDETERAHDEKCGGGGSCSSGGGCGCRVSGRPFRAEAPRKLNVRTGDTVEVSFSSSRALAASLAVFGVPAVSGIGAWIFLSERFPDLGEAALAGLSAAALAAAAALVALVGGLKKNKKLPVITAVINDHRAAG